MQTAHIANEAPERTRAKSFELDEQCGYPESAPHGRYLADELILLAGSVRFPGILAHVVQDMIEKKRNFTNTHIGFFAVSSNLLSLDIR